MINELTLSNFRDFGSLELKGLKRVNLIVGHNNTGKTSLLEGILLLTDPNSINHLPGMFRPAQGNTNLRYFPWLIKDGAREKDAVLMRKNETDQHDLRAILRGPDNHSEQLPVEIYSTVAVNSSGLNIFYKKDLGKRPFCRAISVQHREISSLVTLIGKAVMSCRFVAKRACFAAQSMRQVRHGTCCYG